jgi:hypothetical protein
MRPRSLPVAAQGMDRVNGGLVGKQRGELVAHWVASHDGIAALTLQ